jgi:hypothetical protein
MHSWHNVIHREFSATFDEDSFKDVPQEKCRISKIAAFILTCRDGPQSVVRAATIYSINPGSLSLARHIYVAPTVRPHAVLVRQLPHLSSFGSFEI